MSDFRNFIKNLPHSIDFIRREPQFHFELIRTEQVARQLEEKYDNVGTPPSDIDIKKLLAKVKSKNTALTGREKANIPFLLFLAECDDNTFEYIMTTESLMNWKNESFLSRIVFVYFANYKRNTNSRSEMLREILELFFSGNLNLKRRSLKKIAAQKEMLFCRNNVVRMSKKYKAINASVFTVIEKSGLYKSLDNCPFVLKSLEIFLENSRDLNTSYKYYREITENVEKFTEILVPLGDNIIPLIDKCTSQSLKKKYKKECLDFFYNRFGDPRFSGQSLKWNQVSYDARNIFLMWIAENDLKLFFSIIKQTADNNMWDTREKFWQKYLPKITNTWVFLGKDGQIIAKRLSEEVLLGYGELFGGARQQSVFAFQIKDYVFVEWSHNGKLRVWHEKDAPKLFGYKEVQRTKITWTSPLAKFVHRKQSWELEVRKWLHNNCKI
jgi:hypothetical protein